MSGKKILLLSIAAGLILSSTRATIWQIGPIGDFSTVQEANDSEQVQNRDTLHVNGATNYGNVTLTKRLEVFGPGYFLNENPETQAYHHSAQFSTITFSPGSEGSLISGLEITGIITVATNDITIKRNLISKSIVSPLVIIQSGISNVVIAQNYIKNHTSTASLLQGIEIRSNASSILINNNFIEGIRDVLNSSESAVNIKVINNVLCGSIKIHNALFINNILRCDHSFSGSAVSVLNNISLRSGLGTESGNQLNVDMSTVFVGTGSTDGRWQLKADSPARGTWP